MGILAPQKTIGIKYIEPQRLRRKQKQKIAMCHRTAEQKNFAVKLNRKSCVNIVTQEAIAEIFLKG